MKARVAIVLLNWNGWQDTIECLESLLHLAHTSFAVIVIDNASSDDSMVKINEWCVARIGQSLGFNSVITLTRSEITKDRIPLQHLDVVLIQSESNGGYASGNNLGLRLALLAGCERFWLLNNDTTVDSAALSALEQHMTEHPALGMVGSVLHYYDQPEIIQAVGGVRFSFWRARGAQVGQGLSADDPTISVLAETELTYVAGASMLVSKAFLEGVGLMDEGYFLYFEEIDWACRARERWRVGTAVNSNVFHKEGKSIGTASRTRRSELSQYYLSRNLIRFYLREQPLFIGFAVIAFFLEVSRFIIAREFLLARSAICGVFAGFLGESGKKPG